MSKLYVNTIAPQSGSSVNLSGSMKITGDLEVTGTLHAKTTDFIVSANSTTFGDAASDSLTINAATASVPNGLNFDTNTLVINSANNRVGVGVAAPTTTLDVNGTVNATTFTGGSLSSTGDLTVGDDLLLQSDSAVLSFGAGDDVSITHTNDVGIHLNAGMRLAFRDQGGEYVHSVSDGNLGVVAATSIDLKSPQIDIGEDDASDVTINLLGSTNDMAIVYDESTKKLAFDSTDLVIDAANARVGIGTDSPTNQLEMEVASGDLIFEMDNNASNSANLQIQVGAGNARADIVMNDGSASTTLTLKGQKVGVMNTNPGHSLDVTGTFRATSVATFDGDVSAATKVVLGVDADANDTTANSATGRLGLGASEDLNLYHNTNSYVVNNTGDLIIATEGSNGAGIILDAEDDTVEIKYSGVLGATFDGDGLDLVTGDAYQINGASVLNATTLGSAVVASSLTSVGILTTLQVDNININGAVIASDATATIDATGDIALSADGGNVTMDDGTTTVFDFDVDNVVLKVMDDADTGDFFSIAVGASGATTLTTVDDDAAAAHLVITADGTVDIDSAGTMTLDSGANIHLEPAVGSHILLDGTIQVDAGVVTGATSITSTAFVGGLTGNVTGNASGTALSVTQAAQSAITSLGTLTTLTVDDIIINGGTIGHTSDTDAITIASDGDVTFSQDVVVSGNLTISGTTTQVNTVTMNAQNAVVFEGATADAHETTLTIVDPTADRTINLPNQSGTIPVLAVASNTAVTSTPEELNILDGATVVVGEINALDLGATAVGTAIASKAVILDSDKDYTGIRNFTITGELDAATGDFSGDVDVDGTLEADAITVNGTALNTVIAGVTVTNATNSAHVLVTDNESTNEDNLITFVEGATSSTGNVGLEMDGNLTYNPSTGKLTATQLAGTLQTAAQANVTSLGTLTTLTVDNVIINGSTIGHTGDTDLMTVASGVLTVAGEVDAVSLDISGDADIDGTLEADAITVGGVALATFVRDAVGNNMVSSNTETGITVTYDTSNDNLDFAINAAQTGITSLLATDIKIGEDDQTKIDFEDDNKINFYANNSKEMILEENELTPGTNDGTALGSAALGWSDLFLADGGTIQFGNDQDITLTHTADTGLTLASVASTMPVFTIKNTTNDANGGRLQFVKDKGAAGADGDDIGVIEFIGDDAAQTQTSFAKIVAEVSEADDTDESGKLSLFVAESDGTNTALTQGLILEGAKNIDGRVDATIANGAGSLSRVNGNLMVNTSLSLLEPVGTAGAFVRFAKFLAGVDDNVATTFANISAPNANQAALIRVKVHCSNNDGSKQTFAERDIFLNRASGGNMNATLKSMTSQIDGAAALGTLEIDVSGNSGGSTDTQTRTMTVKCDTDSVNGLNFLVEVEVYTTTGSIAVTPA